jgi:hypothetical protein
MVDRVGDVEAPGRVRFGGAEQAPPHRFERRGRALDGLERVAVARERARRVLALRAAPAEPGRDTKPTPEERGVAVVDKLARGVARVHLKDVLRRRRGGHRHMGEDGEGGEKTGSEALWSAGGQVVAEREVPERTSAFRI